MLKRVFTIFFSIALLSNVFGQCGQCMEQVELIQNGNFSQGNTSFTTSLTLGSGFFCPLCPEGTYAVGSLAFLYHSDFIGQDHTNPPNGQFFIANAAASEGQSVWCQTVNVQPDTDYTFSFWVRDVTNNSDSHPLAIIQAYFNGTPEGASIEAYGGWQQNSFTWNSGSETTVEICLLNFQSNSGGNDFGLDDISLSGCHAVQLSHEAELGNDVTYCGEESFQVLPLQLNGYNYIWTSEDLAISNPNATSQSFTIPNNTELVQSYELVLALDSAGLGCTTYDTLSISILPSVSVDIPDASPLCPGEFYIATIEGSYETITWSDGTVGPFISTNTPGTLSVSVTSQGCAANDETNIEVVNMPFQDATIVSNLCETTLPAVLQSPVSVVWSTGEESNQIEVTDSGNYQGVYTDQGCESTLQFEVTVFTMPQINLEDVYTYCEGSSVTITSQLEGNWSTGETGYSISANEEGTYSVVVENGPCLAADGTIVEMRTIPEVNLGDDVTICEGESIILDAFDAMADSYDWSNDSTSTEIRVNEAGLYSIIVSNECGSSQDEIFVDTELCGWGLYIPNAFTPNLDLKNDGWSVQGYNVSNVKIFVYNRFGDLIWFSEQLNDPWQPDPMNIGDDAYNYRVEAINYFGENIIRHGYVQLLK
ncbi:MAG: gliding motility-associated C-terminal domain-containing protein [Flavobacteriales bacterium]